MTDPSPTVYFSSCLLRLNERNGLCKPFWYTIEIPNSFFFPIPHFTESSDSFPVRPNRNAYGTVGIVFATLLIALSGSVLLLPHTVAAFWPFDTTANAADADSSGPVIHDPSIGLLQAAVNSDPNPNKGSTEIAMSGGAALVPNVGPDGTAADIEQTPSTNLVSTYTVADGDTLSSIAAANGVSVNTIIWANSLAKGASVKPGEQLVILPVTGVEHTVQKGETIDSIATKYKGDAQDIQAYNGLDAGEALTAGEVIIIPNGTLPAAAATPAPTTKAKTTTKTAAKSKPAPKSDLPSVGGFINPLPSGICTQGIHDNNAVDIGAPSGTPIYAAASGTVKIALYNGLWNGGFGNYVVINHSNGTQTLYAHMSRVATTVGADVSQGEVIGYVGRTGEATGNHLHFEVHKAVNPFTTGCP